MRLITLFLVLASNAWAATDNYGTARAELVRVYDGDTITVNIPGWPPVVGEEIGIRVRGVDTPEIRGKCSREKQQALQARDYLRRHLAEANSIELHDIERGKYFRLVATVLADGVDIAQILIAADLGRRYNGGSRSGWCQSN